MEHLELREDLGGLRHYLCGEPVSCGTLLEILLTDGDWLLGRYEANLSSKENAEAFFYIHLGGSWEKVREDDDFVPHVPKIVSAIPQKALFRWPKQF